MEMKHGKPANNMIEGKLVKKMGLFAELGLLPKQELIKVGASMNGPLFVIGVPVIHYLPEHITRQTYGERYLKAVVLVLIAILIQIQITNILTSMALLSDPWVLLFNILIILLMLSCIWFHIMAVDFLPW